LARESYVLKRIEKPEDVDAVERGEERDGPVLGGGRWVRASVLWVEVRDLVMNLKKLECSGETHFRIARFEVVMISE
jgi:hypothetical protein